MSQGKISMIKEADDEKCVSIEAMKLTPELWLEKFEKEGKVVETTFCDILTF